MLLPGLGSLVPDPLTLLPRLGSFLPDPVTLLPGPGGRFLSPRNLFPHLCRLIFRPGNPPPGPGRLSPLPGKLSHGQAPPPQRALPQVQRALAKMQPDPAGQHLFQVENGLPSVCAQPILIRPNVLSDALKNADYGLLVRSNAVLQ